MARRHADILREGTEALARGADLARNDVVEIHIDHSVLSEHFPMAEVKATVLTANVDLENAVREIVGALYASGIASANARAHEEDLMSMKRLLPD